MKRFLVCACLLVVFRGYAQKTKTENLIIVTMDGMRWEEIFGGVDSAILHNPAYTHNAEAVEKMLWHNSPEERRKRLYPFIWNTIAANGQKYGNRAKGRVADVPHR